MKKTTCICFLLLVCMLFTVGCGQQNTPTDAPDGCLRAANDAVDFTFCYADTWQLDRNDGMIGIKLNVASGSAVAYASISAQAYTLADKSVGANDYWDTTKEDLTSLYGDKLTVTKEKEELKLDGVPANRNVYTIEISETVYEFEQVICIRYGTVYLLTYTTPKGGRDRTIDCFETVLQTFAFI